jgi:hypothetical protein
MWRCSRALRFSMRALSSSRLLLAAGLFLVQPSCGCTWGPQTIKIPPLNHAWSFCCPGLKGQGQYAASATYASVNNDQYSLRPGIAGEQLSQSCEGKITKWYDEDFHQDNFQHTTAGTYGPSNFQMETVAMVFWCHNKITSCQIKVDSVSIGEPPNSTLPITANATA